MFDVFLATPPWWQIILVWFFLGWIANLGDQIVGYRHRHRGKG